MSPLAGNQGSGACTVGRSVNYFINRLEANPFSAPSGVSSAVLRSAADKTRAWAEARFGVPNAPHPALA